MLRSFILFSILVGTTANAENVLRFGEHEIALDGTGWVEVLWQSTGTAVGFQFDVNGVTLTSVDSGLTEENEWLISHNDFRVLGAALSAGSYIPPQSDLTHLLTLHVENVGEVISFTEVIFVNDQTEIIDVDSSDELIISPSCTEDVNDDGVVDVSDILEVVGAWGDSGGPSDINEDGIVNVTDLLAVVDAWGTC
jgi:hypothetical protein